MSGQTGEKTEQPTPKKLRDAREKGQVANSKEVVSAFVVITVTLYFIFGFDYVFDAAKAILIAPTMFYTQPFDQALVNTANLLWDKFVSMAIPIVAAAAIAGIAGNYIQIGAIFSFEPLTPKFEKIDPFKGFKRIFSMKNFIEFIKSCLKVLVLAVTCFYVIRINLNDMLKIPVCEEHCIPAIIGHMMFQLVGLSMLAFLAIAFADIFFQAFNHKKELKMTKDEVKREYKDTEGNPEIKGRRRQIHREILEGEGMNAAVKKSSVVITNPIHLAIGLRYISAEKKLPSVTIKGEANLAQQIKELAEEENIPIMENVELAHTLYAGVEEWHTIPRYMMEPVAEVIRWVNALRAEQGLEPL